MPPAQALPCRCRHADAAADYLPPISLFHFMPWLIFALSLAFHEPPPPSPPIFADFAAAAATLPPMLHCRRYFFFFRRQALSAAFA